MFKALTRHERRHTRRRFCFRRANESDLLHLLFFNNNNNNKYLIRRLQ